MPKSVADVNKWLVENGFEEYCGKFTENKIDGETLCCLTERALELLVPIIGDRMKFLKILEQYRKNYQGQCVENVEERKLSESDSMLKIQNLEETDNQELDEVEIQEIHDKSREKPVVTSPLANKPVVLNAKQPWPSTTVLPTNFRPELAAILRAKSGELITKKMRKLFLARIFDQFSQYTLYPTRDQLTTVSKKIIEDYPFLKDKNIGSGYDSWYAQLYEKFRNERRNACDPEVIIHKKREMKEEKSGVNKKLRRGGINWEPPFPEGEDEQSMEAHKGYLKSEWRKRTRNWEKINRRMALTYPSRRRLINEKKLIVNIKMEYPALFCFDQIIAEFERILLVNSSSLVESFTHNVNQVADGIIDMAKKKKSIKENAQVFLSLLQSETPEEEEIESSLDERSQVAMVLLPLVVTSKAAGASHKEFVEFIPEDVDVEAFASKVETPFPKILVKGDLDAAESISIVGEQQVLFNVEGGMTLACLGLLATYYVFMIHYPNSLSNFFIYLQKCILNIPDEKKLPASVVTFVNNLNNFVKDVSPKEM